MLLQFDPAQNPADVLMDIASGMGVNRDSKDRVKAEDIPKWNFVKKEVRKLLFL